MKRGLAVLVATEGNFDAPPQISTAVTISLDSGGPPSWNQILSHKLCVGDGGRS